MDTVQKSGGCLTREDMTSHSNLFQDPISTVYKGIRVWEMPPNGQGLVALIALNILSCLPDDKKGKAIGTSTSSSPPFLLVQKSLIVVRIKEAYFYLDLFYSKLVSETLL